MGIIHPNAGMLKTCWDDQCTPRSESWQEEAAVRRHLCISHSCCRTSQHTILLIMWLMI